MRINIGSAVARTYEGGAAVQFKPGQELRRAVMSCFLWENGHYESGVEIAKRIETLVANTDARQVFQIAEEARKEHGLRHAPLLLAVGLARKGGEARLMLADLLPRIIQRPDEIGEFVSLYWKDGKVPLANAVKRGLARAIAKFPAHVLAKWDQNNAQVKIRDVAFLVHAKPAATGEPAIVPPVVKKGYIRGTVERHADAPLTKLITGTLETADTWESNLSAGANKKETFERLMAEGKLGGLAYLRNLRGMTEAGVAHEAIRGYAQKADVKGVFPFQFITAARHAPMFEPELEQMLFRRLQGAPKLPGVTVVMVDVSGSMDAALSTYNEANRIDAACGLAMILREVCEHAILVTFSDGLVAVPPRRGFALRDALINSQPHRGTYLGKALEEVRNNLCRGVGVRRTIIITDEQSHDKVGGPMGQGYMLNVASHQNGVGYGNWLRIDGFSPATVDYVMRTEKELQGVKAAA